MPIFDFENQSLTNCLKSVSDGKSTVASAITAQGVATAADAAFATMATNIGTAGTNKYNSGYNAGVSAQSNLNNTHPVSILLSAGQTYTVQMDYVTKITVDKGTVTLNGTNYAAGNYFTLVSGFFTFRAVDSVIMNIYHKY